MTRGQAECDLACLLFLLQPQTCLFGATVAGHLDGRLHSAGASVFPMPLDGSTPWQPNGWTIKVEPDGRLLTESRHWSPEKRQVFQQLAAAAAYRAIDAIQLKRLFKQRDDIWSDGSWIIYFLRRDLRDRRTILITISHFYFHGPDAPPPPKGGSRASLELELKVYGSGKRYKIELVRGVLPKRPDEAQILSSIDKSKPGLGRLRFLGLSYWGKGEHVLPNIRMPNVSIYYSPRSQSPKGPYRFGRDIPLLNLPTDQGVAEELHWTSRFLSIFRPLGKVRNGDPATSDSAISRKTTASIYIPSDGQHSIAESFNTRISKTTAKTRLHIQNNPVRPNGFE